MLIQTPEEISDYLYEGSLLYNHEDIQRILTQREAVGPGKSKLSSPMIGIGRPQWWDLAKLAKEAGKPISPKMEILLKDANFYLVNLACSFRPSRSSWVEAASFSVYMRAKNGNAEPIAYDLFPRDIQEETKTDVKFGISPSLKFTDLEVKLGTVDFTLQCKKLEPVITAFGALQPDPGWDFMRTKKQDIRGPKFMYLIVKRPKGVEAVRISFELSAQVRIRQGLLAATIDEEIKSHLSTMICY